MVEQIITIANHTLEFGKSLDNHNTFTIVICQTNLFWIFYKVIL